MRVAEAAIAAARDHHALPDDGQVRQQGLAILFIDLRAGRDFHHDVPAVRSMAVLAHAGAAVLRGEMLLVAVVDQRVEAVDGGHDDIAATPPVAAVRSAELDELLAPERHAAVPAVARAD